MGVRLVLFAEKVSQYLSDISTSESLNPEARFIKKVKRVGSVTDAGDAGLLLNDDALRVLLTQVRELIEGLYIRQGKGYLQVNNVVVDYNESGRVFRSEEDPSYAKDNDAGAFAQYYTEQALTDDEFKSAQEALAVELSQKDKGKKGKKVSSKKTKAPAEK